jgi:hypothetical protein
MCVRGDDRGALFGATPSASPLSRWLLSFVTLLLSLPLPLLLLLRLCYLLQCFHAGWQQAQGHCG